MMWIIISLLLFSVFAKYIMNRNNHEHVRGYSIRFVFGVLLLYIVHLCIRQYGIDISINLFSISMVVLLGLPGMITVVVLSFLK